MSRLTLHANSKNVSSGEGTGTGVPEFIEHHATVTEWRLDGSNSLSTQPIYNDTMKEHVKKHQRNKFERQVVLPGNEHSRRSATCCDLYLINDVFLSNDIKWKSCRHIEPSLPEIRFIHVHSHHLRQVCECSSHATSQAETWRRAFGTKNQSL